MKMFILFLLIVSSIIVKAQQLVMQSGVEKTVAGLEYGANMFLETKRMWALGSFYQTRLNRDNPEGSLQMKNIFYGVLFQGPIMKNEKLSFLFNLRMGLVNERFLAVVPSVETRIHVSERTGFSVGTGLRMSYPSFSFKVFVKLFKK
jgi:hypothetical protein